MTEQGEFLREVWKAYAHATPVPPSVASANEDRWRAGVESQARKQHVGLAALLHAEFPQATPAEVAEGCRHDMTVVAFGEKLARETTGRAAAAGRSRDQRRHRQNMELYETNRPLGRKRLAEIRRKLADDTLEAEPYEEPPDAPEGGYNEMPDDELARRRALNELDERRAGS